MYRRYVRSIPIAVGSRYPGTYVSDNKLLAAFSCSGAIASLLLLLITSAHSQRSFRQCSSRLLVNFFGGSRLSTCSECPRHLDHSQLQRARDATPVRDLAEAGRVYRALSGFGGSKTAAEQLNSVRPSGISVLQVRRQATLVRQLATKAIAAPSNTDVKHALRNVKPQVSKRFRLRCEQRGPDCFKPLQADPLLNVCLAS